MRKILMLALLCPYFSYCQPIALTGTIINEEMEPVAGATVVVKRTGATVVSDEGGKFRISNLQAGDTIVITVVGYEMLTEVVEAFYREQMTFIIKRRASMMEDVVINTGYHAVKKESSTGSFEKIESPLLNRRVGPDIISRLEGISSIYFDRRQNGGKISLRGRSTIFGNADPLIILDNFPYEGDLSDINPEEIESVTVLKDAAAASIWGVRAGNGVIVLSTKRGSLSGKPVIQFNSSITRGGKPDVYYSPQMNSGDFIDVESFLFNRGYYNAVLNNVAKLPVTPVVEMLARRRAGQVGADDSALFINSLRGLDVRDEINRFLYRPSVQSQYSVQVSGGTPQVRYFVSGGYDKNLPNVVNNKVERTSIRSQASYLPAQGWQVDLGLSFTQTVRRQNVDGPVMLNAAGKQLYPYARLVDNNGTALPIVKDHRLSFVDTAGTGKLLDWHFRPLDEIGLADNMDRRAHALFNLGVSRKLSSSLLLSARYQYEFQPSDVADYYSEETYITRNLINRFTQVNGGQIKYGVPLGGILDLSNALLYSHNGRLQVNFDKQLHGGHDLHAITGGEVRETSAQSNTYRTYGYSKEILTYSSVNFVDNFPLYAGIGSPSKIPNPASFSETTLRYASFFSSAEYSYRKQYFITASGRKDASNIFGVNANMKGVPLWSAGVGWELSKAGFYSVNAIPYLKLRGTYGYSGNVDNSISALTTIQYNSDAVFTGYRWAQIITPPNPYLQWEKVRTVNMGADFRIKGDLLTGSVDYYVKQGTGLIGESPLDPTTGVETGSLTGAGYRGNVAETRGRGFEADLRLSLETSDFSFQSQLLFSYAHSHVSKYLAAKTNAASFLNSGNVVSTIQGRPIFAIYSYKWAGLDTLGDPVGYVDGQLSKDYRAITTGEVDDLLFHGSALPEIFGSLRNTIRWKNLTLSANIIYKLKYFYRRTSINYSSLFALWQGHSDYEKRWQASGDEEKTSVPRMVYPAVSARETFYNNSSVLVEPGDHIRLQDIQINWSIIKRSTRNLHFSAADVFVYINNLPIIWKKSDKNLDPDYYSSFSPRPLTYAVGVKLKL